MGRNSSSSKNSRADILKNERIKNSKEKTEFLDKITVNEKPIPRQTKHKILKSI
jgi:hypothetical protein